MPGRTDFFEIDISLLNVCIDQLHPDPFANIQPLESIHQLAFNRDIEKPDPCAFLGCAGHNRIEPSLQSLISSRSAAADFSTCRSTLVAASSASVQ